MKLEYTAAAVGDLIRLREFVAIHDPAAAERIAKHLPGGINSLLDHPKQGHPVTYAPEPGFSCCASGINEKIGNNTGRTSKRKRSLWRKTQRPGQRQHPAPPGTAHNRIGRKSDPGPCPCTKRFSRNYITIFYNRLVNILDHSWEIGSRLLFTKSDFSIRLSDEKTHACHSAHHGCSGTIILSG